VHLSCTYVVFVQVIGRTFRFSLALSYPSSCSCTPYSDHQYHMGDNTVESHFTNISCMHDITCVCYNFCICPEKTTQERYLVIIFIAYRKRHSVHTKELENWHWKSVLNWPLHTKWELSSRHAWEVENINIYFLYLYDNADKRYYVWENTHRT
jgi:hypothetical protein